MRARTTTTLLLLGLLLMTLGGAPMVLADEHGEDAEEERPLLWDVPEGFVHEPGIRWVAEQGITTGFEDGSFRPADPVTRGQMATFLDRALELEPGDESFPDVPEDFVHAAAIAAVAAAGITTGFEDGTFRPADPVTRGQMATFLQRALDEDAPLPPVDPEAPETPETSETPQAPTDPDDGDAPDEDDPAGAPGRPDAPGPPGVDVRVGSTDLGAVLVDGQGMTLYMFDNDDQGSGESSCTSVTCVGNWPPLLVDAEPQGGPRVDDELLGTITRDDGSVQVTYDGWPLYGWINDEQPGDIDGQGRGDVWWMIAPDGTPLREGGAG